MENCLRHPHETQKCGRSRTTCPAVSRRLPCLPFGLAILADARRPCFWPTSGLPTIQLQSGRVVPNGFMKGLAEVVVVDRFTSLRTQLLALLGGLGEDD